MKRNTLYTIDKYNGPAIVNRLNRNIYDGFDTSLLNTASSAGAANIAGSVIGSMGNKTPDFSSLASAASGAAGSGGGGIAGALGGLVGGGGGGIGGALKGAVGSMGGMSGIASAVGGAVGNLIGGGYSSGVGNVMGSLGKVASVIPGPYGAAISAGLQVLGGGVNRLFGSKVDAVRLGKANEEMNKLNSFTSNASSLDDIKSREATASVAGIYQGGVWNKSAKKQQEELEEQMRDARQFADRSIGNNVNNLVEDQMNNSLANYASFGGPLFNGDYENDMSAVDYGFMTDFLTEKKRQNDLKNKMVGMTQIPNFINNGYAEGGTFGGGSFYGSGAGGGWDEAPADTYNVNNFNQAFDAAVADGLKEFTFQGRRYNTQKENNPVREFNNRWVGQGRRANKKNPSKTYDHQAGPLGGPLADIPMVVDTHIGTPERPPLLEFNPNAMERGKSLPYSWSYTVDRPKKIQPAKAEVPLFAFGGDLQTNGSDFPTGLTYVNAGGSHEENPYEGVQMGVDPQGVPNLVEEGETVFNDYVYSTRIPIDDITKERFHIGKKREMTYADLSKKLEKEVSERPNDPISQAAFKAQMADLAEEQERQKAEMEAARAREAFEALSPEEQTALMQQAAQQEQMAQEQAIQEQAMAEQAAAEQQSTPEEIAIAEQQQQMVQGVPTADAMGTMETAQPQMACGGKLNKFDEGGKKNVGKWKNDKENHWDVFTKPGLRKYIENVRQKLKMAPDEETKNAIRRDAMNELNTLQQSYYDYVREGAANPTHGYSDDILRHQQMFDRLYGNTGFYTTDKNGNVRNLIAESIDLPNGAATEDKPSNWVDGYNGPRTSIRNFGSTAYGDNKYYQDLVDEFAGLGLTYAPNENWKYGENELYGLSIPESTPAEGTTAKAWDWNSGSWVDKPQEQPVAENSGNNGSNGNNNPAAGTGDDREVVPIHRNENWRYAGLLGPAVGLGMQALGIGRPDTSGLEAAANSGGNYTTASWMPIGDYMRYTPLDRLFEGNRIQANARATDRALMNTSGGNRGTAMAGLLANGYNTQIALGTADRQGDESNWNKYAQTKTFNRGTNQFNAEAFNRNSEFNANAYNNAARNNAQMKLHAAQAKMDADAGWYNSIYGNVSGLLKGVGDIGRENAQRNMISDMAATGLFGQMTPNTYIANGMLRYETDEERAKRLAKQKNSGAKGGKIKRKKGFTY